MPANPSGSLLLLPSDVIACMYLRMAEPARVSVRLAALGCPSCYDIDLPPPRLGGCAWLPPRPYVQPALRSRHHCTALSGATTPGRHRSHLSLLRRNNHVYIATANSRQLQRITVQRITEQRITEQRESHTTLSPKDVRLCATPHSA